MRWCAVLAKGARSAAHGCDFGPVVTGSVGLQEAHSAEPIVVALDEETVKKIDVRKLRQIQPDTGAYIQECVPRQPCTQRHSIRTAAHTVHRPQLGSACPLMIKPIVHVLSDIPCGI